MHQVQAALAEDKADQDVTVTAVIDPQLVISLDLRARECVVVAGLALAEVCFRTLSPQIDWQQAVADGEQVAAGSLLARITGTAGALLSAERTALNFVQHLSGIATLTRRYMDAVAGTKAIILDTRKTIPGMRLLAKYATAVGGAQNHRLNLADGMMIKDNHIAANGGSLPQTLAKLTMARDSALWQSLVVECDTLDQVQLCLHHRIPHLLLDNMSPQQLAQAVALRDGAGYAAKLEASGGVNLDSIRAIAASGVDYISVGRLTMSAPAVDIGLDWPT
ncbi:MAG: carboxylating nicotinate-nucleotide diphosphorylase [Alphaproteobacteria bacterium]|nr:carboxylating nicotinate-nucleotide diphosphorylase [Alphaproteobacteria bacterium]